MYDDAPSTTEFPKIIIIDQVETKKILDSFFLSRFQLAVDRRRVGGLKDPFGRWSYETSIGNQARVR